MKRLSADDSAGSRVKVGHRQAINARSPTNWSGFFIFAVYLKAGDRTYILSGLRADPV